MLLKEEPIIRTVRLTVFSVVLSQKNFCSTASILSSTRTGRTARLSSEYMDTEYTESPSWVAMMSCFRSSPSGLAIYDQC